ncbi:hypothetical protein HNP84_007835 [Thermocatellispora tengchongensis]|uniref:DUF998 domain-containing protein n=1 Tax=Thermocatellispora tengchongensis TaxID=1073253 RepID=A0A840PG02_9ACTN|nr:DUF998 domain-containing protein [Thermocatellispora tengchongensis]MBB5138082.1 hypothetical protein [Thermocatellispora tengchongensis]
MQAGARAGLWAVGAGSAVILALDAYAMTTGEFDLARRTISQHGLGPGGWIFALAVVALAAGSLAIGVSLVRRRLAAALSLGMLALLLWCAALVTVAWFPKHDWTVGPSMSGTIHRIASVVAFASLPVAALLLTRPWWRRPAARVAALLGLASLLWVAGITAVIVHAGLNGLAWWRVMPLGLVERGLAVTEVATVLALGAWAALHPGRPARVIPPRVRVGQEG